MTKDLLIGGVAVTLFATSFAAWRWFFALLNEVREPPAVDEGRKRDARGRFKPRAERDA